MNALSTALALSLGLAIVGCNSSRNRQTAPPSAPVSADALAELQAAFQQTEPNARLGAVDEVLADQMFLTVADVSATDFPLGTAVAVIDSNRAVIATGDVVRTFPDSVHVRYQAKGARVPRAGDVAVRF